MSSQLVCILITILNIVYIEIATKFEFHGLGYNYFFGPSVDGTYAKNVSWIDTVVPRHELAYFINFLTFPACF